MSNDIERALWRLAGLITYRLDKIHDETLAKFRTLARSTGQLTRVDRAKK